MNFLLYLKAAILGLIEGATEFIPVSSTGHLIIFSDLLNFNNNDGKVFEIVIQTGAILAVCFLYRQKLFHTLLTLKTEKSSQKFTSNLLLAFAPAVVFGFTFHDYIKKYLFSSTIVAISLIVGGIIMITIEKIDAKKDIKKVDNLKPITALKIGFFQLFALIPGVSRSGATIIGGLLCGLKRTVATEFSFFLAIPTIFGATAYDLYVNYQFLQRENIITILIGFIFAFLSSIVTIKWLINFVSKHNFIAFGYYRIIVGCIILLSIFLW
jgi:undecaprenyl-diphosphatase